MITLILVQVILPTVFVILAGKLGYKIGFEDGYSAGSRSK